AGQALDFRIGEIDHLRLVILIAHDFSLSRLTTAEFEHQFGGAFETRDHVFRVDAALKAVTGIGDDAEATAGLRDVHRIPERGFDQHVDGVLVATRMFAAHDAADRLDAVFIGDNDIVAAELVFALVERQHRLAILGAADRQVAFDLGGVEDVHRTALVEGHVVGDIDERIDRTQADSKQPLLHPLRARAVLDATHDAQAEARAELLVIEIERQLDRGFAFDRERRRGAGLQRAEAGGGQIAGDAVDRGAVRTVRREIDLDDRIIEMSIGGERGSDRRIGGQIDDAVVIVGHVELLFGAHHAMAFDATDLADAERHVDAGDIIARPCQRADETGARIRRTADDLQRLAAVD
ncbi:conserved hypothetical protein, partial [Ricinus communis]